MGERSGNVATVDVVYRQLEQAMAALNAESKPISKIARRISSAVLSRTVAMDPQIANNLKNWNTASENISRIFGPHAEFRWQRTIIGNPYKYDNGSGPHDQAMAAAISDPVNHPPYKHYQWGLVPGSMMGVKIADLLAIGDPEAIDSVTVANYAGGRKTQMIKNGEIKRAPEAEIEIARRNFEKLKFNIAERALSGVRIIPA
jgi:hypothetical protein